MVHSPEINPMELLNFATNAGPSSRRDPADISPEPGEITQNAVNFQHHSRPPPQTSSVACPNLNLRTTRPENRSFAVVCLHLLCFFAFLFEFSGQFSLTKIIANCKITVIIQRYYTIIFGFLYACFLFFITNITCSRKSD